MVVPNVPGAEQDATISSVVVLPSQIGKGGYSAIINSAKSVWVHNKQSRPILVSFSFLGASTALPIIVSPMEKFSIVFESPVINVNLSFVNPADPSRPSASAAGEGQISNAGYILVSGSSDHTMTTRSDIVLPSMWYSSYLATLAAGASNLDCLATTINILPQNIVGMELYNASPAGGPAIDFSWQVVDIAHNVYGGYVDSASAYIRLQAGQAESMDIIFPTGTFPLVKAVNTSSTVAGATQVKVRGV